MSHRMSGRFPLSPALLTTPLPLSPTSKARLFHSLPLAHNPSMWMLSPSGPSHYHCLLLCGSHVYSSGKWKGPMSNPGQGLHEKAQPEKCEVQKGRKSSIRAHKETRQGAMCVRLRSKKIWMVLTSAFNQRQERSSQNHT